MGLFALGLFLGVIVGVSIMCLVTMGKRGN